MRDVIDHVRSAVGAADSKFLQQLQIAYGMLRHMAPDEILQRCQRIGRALRGDDCPASAAAEHGAQADERQHRYEGLYSAARCPSQFGATARHSA